MTHFDVAIVGAGHGGAHVAIALRKQRFAGTIGLIGEEAALPYERPPLSKDYLGGKKLFAQMLIRPATYWTENDVAMLMGRKVTAIDAAAHQLGFEDGDTASYGTLVWAAGGSPRRLTCSGHDLVGVHCVRTLVDVNRMIDELSSIRNVVVIGGGYIGLEAAAMLNTLGKQVTIVEALDRVLARVAGEPLSRFYEAEHRARGVDVRLGAKVACIEEAGGRAVGVRLDDGELLPADMVIVGIGIVPAVAPLIAAGADGGNGVRVDETCRTSLPDVFAIGDCAVHPNPFADGAPIRLESVQNATDQALVVAKTILGMEQTYHTVPWFWSEQYDLRLQTVGLSTGHDAVVMRGDPISRSFSVVYTKLGHVIALDCVNSVKDYVQGRALVVNGTVAPPERLADPATPLNRLVTPLH